MSKAGGNVMDFENPCEFTGCKVGGTTGLSAVSLLDISVAGVKQERLEAELATTCTFFEAALVLLGGGIICKQMEGRGEL